MLLPGVDLPLGDPLMPVFRFNVGDIVQSTYRGQWIGLVLDRLKRKDTTPLYTVRAVLDRNGQPVGKSVRSQVRRLDEAWLKPYKPKNPEEAKLIEIWSNPSAGRAVLPARAAHQMPTLRTRTIRMAASLPVGDPLRSDLLWEIQAVQMFDVDKLGGSLTWRAEKALQHIGGMVTHGKKPVWVIDVAGALKTVRDISKEIAEHAEGSLLEAAAYASEAQDWEEEGTLNDLAKTMKRTRFRVEPVVSPRSGKPGYKITW